MAILLAYFSVVLIWATTPLTIQWSSDSLSFIAAVLLRMALALALGLLINVLLRRKLFAVDGAWKAYAAGAIGIFPNMPVVYWAAQYISSGLIAVIFALSPFVMGLMTILLLKQNPFNARRFLALVIALLGLVTIFYEQFHLKLDSVYGIAGILSSCFMFSFSSVLVKKTNISVDSFNQMLGSLLFSLPCLALCWWLLDGQIPAAVSTKSLLSISYLSVVGSLLGISLFFFVLANMSPTAVSLITFMTPILSLVIGNTVAHESLSWQLWAGAACVIFALLIYIDLSAGNFLLKALHRRAWQPNLLRHLKNEHLKFK
jgi:drug/metabolite transporter (DMT)-like permease